jgi:cellulose biosynthesis protein BcsQ
MKPFWITFYSYKGGVGRSLALANIAALLVQRGRRVILIDFDLEAPGLDSFEEFKSISAKPGVVEYVTEFQDRKQAPDISQFLHHCELPGYVRGKLWIMPAGRKDAAYNVHRSQLDWTRLYDWGLGEPFVENWKAAIAHHCEPDYVLVDSRTGLTDVGGICTLHLPDLVVMIFGLNEQNVHGIEAVAKTIRESDFYRLPQIHYVASPVPNLPRDKKGPLVQRWTKATKRLGTKIKSSIRYQQLAALSEKLFVLDPDLESSPLCRDYQELLESLIEYNRTGLDFLLKQNCSALNSADDSLIVRLSTVFEQEFPTRAEALMARAKLRKAMGDPETATSLARQALDADPLFEDALEWLIERYRRDGDHKSALSLFDIVLPYSDRLPLDRLCKLYDQQAQSAMAATQYSIATKSYAKCSELIADKNKQGDLDPEVVMITMFNATEALRRKSRDPQTINWQVVITLFGSSGDSSTAPLVLQAKHWQAMHIPFALTGDVGRARDALAKARQAAEHLGPAEDIFTVKTYTEVPVKDFLQVTEEMLAALDRGQLWDGMSLPLANLEKQVTSQANRSQAVRP